MRPKNSRASKDGWLWGDYSGEKLQERARSFEPPYPRPPSNFGMNCLNCHTIAARESTFSDLAICRNPKLEKSQHRVLAS